jgi:TonB family protein
MEHLTQPHQPISGTFANWKIKAFQVCLLLFFLQYNLSAKASTCQDSIPGEIHRKVDQLPTFPGGQQALFVFLAENLNAPVSPQANKTLGQVVVKFVVFKDGTVGNIGIMKSLAPAEDEEAMRVVKAMPKWIPGKLKGEDVNVEMGIPIRFDFLAEATFVKGKLICEGVDKVAIFPDGGEALMKYIVQNLEYPQAAKHDKIQGDVLVQFFIEKDGRVTQPIVTRGLDASIEKEILRLFAKMPKWEPSRLNGEPVRTVVRNFEIVLRIY